MTVNNQPALSGPTRGDGVTKTFVFPYRFDSSTELVVVSRSVSTLVETQKSLNVDYTLVGAGPPYLSGAIVTFVVAPTADEDITRYRNTIQQQPIPIGTQIDLPSSSIETIMDKCILILQEMQEQINRCVKITRATLGINLTLPSPVALRSLRWKADLSGFENSLYNPDDAGTAAAASQASATSSATSAGSSAGSAATAVAAANAAAASANAAGISAAAAAASAALAASVVAGVLTTKGDLVTYAAGAVVRLGVGADGLAIVADSAQTKGLKWGQVGTAGIADNAITQAKLEAGLLGKNFVHLQDQKSTGTAGGTSTGSAWNTRVLNTEVADTGNICSLASNQFTLTGPGTFRIEARCPAQGDNGHKARLYNITDSATTLVGSSERDSSANTVQTSSLIYGRFTIAATKTFEIQHYFASALATQGLGNAGGSGNGEIEIYTNVIIVQEN